MTPYLPELLQRPAAREPDRIAVRDEDGELTYAAFLSEVHRLAHHLIQGGCEKGTWVACCLPRGVQAVVAQAAVMAAGAVYVPVDPTYPPALLGEMLTGRSPIRVIGHQAGLAACRSATEVITIALDDDDTLAAVASCPADPPQVDLRADDGAYVIHTSGSSGTPKAVLVGHGAIANSTLARWTRYPEDVAGFLMVSPMFFDSSMAGIWWTLSQGGTLELAPRDPGALVARVRRALTDPSGQISHTLLTPTLYSRALDGLDRARSALRHVIVAGEVCSAALVRQHHALLPDVELVNEYGPTEAAVWCTSAVLRPDADVTIGTAIENVELMVLDPAGRPAPIGEAGELCIAGVQLAQGYPRDAELTAQRFAPHPDRPGERMYRTGDRCWLRPDGQYVVSGRLDDQVKVRGHRVDLAGVRTRLGQHPGVSAVALALRERPGSAGQVLTAYVVPDVASGSVERKLREAWTQVVDEVAATAAAGGTDFDISGWNSSYTGRPLPDEDMAEWVRSTVALLREGAPQAVLDLGCGSGLPLLRVAPHCARYVGLDVSGRTLEGLRKAVTGAGLRNVELRQGEASDVVGFAGDGFDLVVSNSVSQYFPSGDYLACMIAGGLAALSPLGRVVVGDVRDLGLLWEFHTAVVLARSAPDTPASEVLSRVALRVEQEAQLVVSPRWFATLPDLEVEVRPRRGWRRNEMNDFRYDFVGHAAGSVTRFDVPRWLDWSRDVGALNQLGDLLRGRREPIGVRQVPNARTAGASAVVARLAAGASGTVADLRSLSEAQDRKAVHPEALVELAAVHGCRVHLDRSAAHDAGALDVVFVPHGAADLSRGVRLPRFDVEVAEPGALITDPARHRITAGALTHIVPELRRHAERVLAPQERPGAYVVLSALPTTRQGKVDLGALPAPLAESLRADTPFVAPRSATEIAVAAVWASVLGVDRVGLDDDFVELGGDSLLAAACAVRLGDELDLALPAGVLFSAPTVRALALVVEQASPRTVPRIVDRRAPGATLPLTSAQTLFWFLDHYRRPGSSQHPDFTLSVHYRISGRLDVQALSGAIDQLVERHEALRTRVQLDASEGRQTVMPPTSGILSLVQTTAADVEATLQAAGRDDASRPLDPSSGRVFTAQLTSASHTEHLLVLRVHHMVSDGWSIDVLEAELEALYKIALAGYAPEIAPPPSYRDHVEQIDRTFFVDLDWRDAEPYRKALTYWDNQVAGVRPTVLSVGGETGVHLPTRQQTVNLASGDLDTLLEQSRRQGATLFSTIVAALACLRAEDAGDPDVRLLTLNAARDVPGLDRMVGLLLNPMLLRLNVQPGAGLASVLSDASARVREALAHGQAPLLAMCEEIPDLMSFMTGSQFVGVELLSPARGLQLGECRIVRTDPFDDDFLGRRFELPIELLLVVRRYGSSVRLTVLHDPAVIDDDQARSLLTRLRRLLVQPVELETI